jgi:integrase
MPLRAIYRQALALDEVAVNATTGVQLPAVRGTRERIASPVEAELLLAALPAKDRAVWATARYAGLRSGELQALTGELVDLDDPWSAPVNLGSAVNTAANETRPLHLVGRHDPPLRSRARARWLDRHPRHQPAQGGRLIAYPVAVGTASGPWSHFGRSFLLHR